MKRLRDEDPVQMCIDLLEGAPNESLNGVSEHDLDAATIQATLKNLSEHWCSAASGHMDRIAAERFGVLELFDADTLVPYGDNGIKIVMMRKQLCILRLRYHFVRLGLLDLDSDHITDDIAGAAANAMFSRIQECLQRLYDTLMMSLLTRKCLDPQWASDCPSADDPYYVRCFDINKLQPNALFLVYVLEKAQKMGLRRYNGACYVEIESPPMVRDGRAVTFKTHAWRKFMEIPEFVNKVAPKETNFSMWQTAVDGPAKHRAIEQLQKGYDCQFPDLEPNRHFHSFHNGIYDTVHRAFYPWTHQNITPDIVCCKFHDKVFDSAIMSMNWRDVPTPGFDKILNVQLAHVEHIDTGPGGVPKKWTAETAAQENQRLQNVYDSQVQYAQENNWTAEEIEASIKLESVTEGSVIKTNEGAIVKDWAYVFGGRLLYPVNSIDTWQVMPMFVGRAGTGKSLILSTWARFFDDADVATIANDVQPLFGLENVWNKFVWMIKEVKHDLKLDQAQLQSMITGEEMSIGRKGKEALQITWKSPGVMAGNELANWTDNSGSMSRRMVLFYFHKKVHQSDPKLAQQLSDELPALLHKCNMAYAEACSLYGHCDIWGRLPDLTERLEQNPNYRESRTILPSYFHANKSNLKQQTHLMENFLANPDELEKRAGTGMPFELDREGYPSFKTLANIYFKKLDSKPFQWSKSDRYMATLEDYELEVRKLTEADRREGRHIYNGREYEKDTTWIFGVVPKDQLQE